MTLLLILPALAHVPHDMVGYFAAPADLSSSHRWWVGGFLGAQTELYWSDNQGMGWSRSSALPSTYYIDDMTYLDDGTLVVASGRDLLYSYDDGDTWSVRVAPDRVKDLAGSDRLWMATASGLWETADPADDATLSVQGSFEKVEAVAKTAGAVGTDGVAWTFVDGVWTDITLPLGDHANAVSADGQYVGTFDGLVYQVVDGQLTSCGPLLGTGAPHASILKIAHDGEHVVVVTGLGGPYIGEDGCSGWLDHTLPLAPAYGMAGGVHDQEDAYTVLMTVGSRYVVGGWAGLYLSANYGTSWRETRWFLNGIITGLPKPDLSGSGADDGGMSLTPSGADLDPSAGPDEGGETPARGCMGAASHAVLALPLLGLLRRRRRAE